MRRASREWTGRAAGRYFGARGCIKPPINLRMLRRCFDMTDEDMGRIIRLKQQGKSAAAIAEMLHLPANTVKSYLRRHPGTENAHICRSATQWIFFPKNAKRTKGKCRSIMWRATMTPSLSLRNGSSCRRRYSGERTRGGSQHGDLKPETAGVSGLCQMSPVAFSVCGNL